MIVQLEEILAEKDINIAPEQVSYCLLLPQKKGAKTGAQDNGRAVVLRLVSRSYKEELLKQAKNLKGSGIYMNENLTKVNATIAWKARQLKKGKKIENTWTSNCRIFVKQIGADNQRPVLIRALEELDQFDDQ